MEILFVPTLSVVYLLVVVLLEPGFAHRPYAFLTHLLLLLGMGTLFLVLSNLLTLNSLRRWIRRDQEHLLRAYVDLESFRKKLLGDDFWDCESEDAKLGGGLIHKGLLRSTHSGKLSAETFPLNVSDGLARARFGRRLLDFSIRSAPLLGLLGTVVALMATFESGVIENAGGSPMSNLIPYIGIALVTTMLGMAIALVGLASRDLIDSDLCDRCVDRLRPIVLRIGGHLEALGEERPELPNLPALKSNYRPWSEDFERARFRKAMISLLAVSVLIVAVCLPGGPMDELLQVDLDEATARSRAQAGIQPAPRLESDPEPTVRSREISMPIDQLLDQFSEGLLPENGISPAFGYSQYRKTKPLRIANTGSSLRFLTHPSDQTPIGGFFDRIPAPFTYRHLDRAFPRLIARWDCVLKRDSLEVLFPPPLITYAVSDGSALPVVKTAPDFVSFDQMVISEGYSISSHLLEDFYLRALLPSYVIQSISSAADEEWSKRGYPDEHERVTVWFAFESKQKLEHAKTALKAARLEGGFGDYVQFNWMIAEGSGEIEARLHSAEMVPYHGVESAVSESLAHQTGALNDKHRDRSSRSFADDPGPGDSRSGR